MATPLDNAIQSVKRSAKIKGGGKSVTSPVASKVGASGHGMSGHVCEICEHETDPTMAHVTVRHHAAPKKGQKGTVPYNTYDKRTRLQVPKAKAQSMRIGQKVRLAIHPDGGDDASEASEGSY